MIVEKCFSVLFIGADLVTKPLKSVMQSPPAPLRSMDGVHLEQTARVRDTQKKPHAYREEGYRVTMETDGPTPVADGGGEGIGGWV